MSESLVRPEIILVKQGIILEDPSKESAELSNSEEEREDLRSEEPAELAADAPEAEQYDPETKRVVRTHFSGPLPPPSLLREYNEIVPQGAERIFQIAEKEQAHTHKIDSREMTLQLIGAIGLMLVVLILAGIGGTLLFLGKNVGGFTALILALGPLFYSGFLRSKSSSKGGD